MSIKFIVKRLLKYMPFYPKHIGAYTRNLYFWKYTTKLPINSFSCILEAGCGWGEYAKKIALKYPYLKIDAYDIKKYESWDNKSKNINFEQKDLLKLEKENYYNFCLCIDVLEHIPENYKVLENIYRALKYGGYFYLHIPGKDKKRIFPKRFFKAFNNWEKEEHIGVMYTLKELKDIMSSIGFEIIKTRRTFGFFGSFAWEIDRITDRFRIVKIVLMPLLKIFGHLDVIFSKKGANILILAIKK